MLALADTGAAAPTPPRACGADSMYTRVPVYLRVTVENRADTVAATELVLLAESVAARIRAAVGGPRGDTLFYVRQSDPTAAPVWLGGVESVGLRVVAHRDGTLRWSSIRDSTSPAAAVLGRALADAKAADDAFIPPVRFRSDSLPFVLSYARPHTIVGGPVSLSGATLPSLAVFTLRAGVEKLAVMVPGTARVEYPESALRGRLENFVRLRFVVDTNGRADPSTIRDVPSQDRMRLADSVDAQYDRFVHAAAESVARARYQPAEIAGCRVRQLVELPFTFTLNR